MSRLVVAEGAVLEAVLDATYPVWNDGLTREAYAQWNAAQMRTRWGRDRLHRLALIDEQGRVLASAKRYQFTVRLDGVERPMLGIGAVFTPAGMRGRGHARELVERMLAEAPTAGAALVLLFSEIGPEYYERLGFVPVPMEEVTLDVRAKAGAPAMLVRSGEERDLAAVAALHDVRSTGSRFALRRDPDFIGFAVARKRLLAGLGPRGLRQTEFFVAEEGVSAVAYAVLTVTGEGWFLEEAGDRDPAGARLGAMLQVLLAREPSLKRPTIRAWLPSGFLPPQVSIALREPASEILMIKPLEEGIPSLAPQDIFYWHNDLF